MSEEAQRHKAGLETILQNSPVIDEAFDEVQNETIITGRSSLLTYERRGDSYYYLIASSWIVCEGRGACDPEHVLVLFTAGSGGGARHEETDSRTLKLISGEEPRTIAQAGYQRDVYREPAFNTEFIAEYLLATMEPRDFLRLVEDRDMKARIGRTEFSLHTDGCEGFEALAESIRKHRAGREI